MLGHLLFYTLYSIPSGLGLNSNLPCIFHFSFSHWYIITGVKSCCIFVHRKTTNLIHIPFWIPTCFSVPFCNSNSLKSCPYLLFPIHSLPFFLELSPPDFYPHSIKTGLIRACRCLWVVKSKDQWSLSYLTSECPMKQLRTPFLKHFLTLTSKMPRPEGECWFLIGFPASKMLNAPRLSLGNFFILYSLPKGTFFSCTVFNTGLYVTESRVYFFSPDLPAKLCLCPAAFWPSPRGCPVES